VDCYLKAREITGDPDFFRNCGRSAAKYKSFENWHVIARTISGPVAAINYLPEVIPDWNDTKIFELVRPARFSMMDQKVRGTLKYNCHPEIDPCDDYCSDQHILGLTFHVGSQCADPRNWDKGLRECGRRFKAFPTLEMVNIGGGFPVYDRTFRDNPSCRADVFK
jgi:hypothetical protein